MNRDIERLLSLVKHLHIIVYSRQLGRLHRLHDRAMWRLGAIREGAAGLVKQGAGAVKQGVAVGARFLENLEEVRSTRKNPVAIPRDELNYVPRRETLKLLTLVPVT